MKSNPEILIFDNPEELATAAAVKFLELSRSFIARQGRFSVALAGGNTPRRVYELLATDEFKTQIQWRDVHLFFGDERPVTQDHPASNFGMALAALIPHVPIPASNVHPIPGEGDSYANGQLYEKELKAFFPNALWPRFDLVLLGMGEDGHTASLFPGTAALAERIGWVVANWVEKLGEFRITLTVPAINAAANIIFLVTGEKKAVVLAEIFGKEFEPARFPAQLIRPQGSLIWMVDAAAGKLLGRVDK